MIALYLLAAHLVGDFLFQTRWQAARKLDDAATRLRHVSTYTLAFIPVVLASGADARHAGGFLAWTFVLHFVTDSRRFHSTIGDWVTWNVERKTRGLRLDPNPWQPLPILIDQSLHVAQLAVLGGLWLS